MQNKYNSHSRFGEFGGQFIPETLMYAVKELEEQYERYKDDPQFIEGYQYLLKQYSGRETPLFFAERLTEKLNGGKIFLKREDLNHTGAHKINNTIGQALLARRMGKRKIVAETGAGQHGVATATVCALLDMECIVFMGEEDVQRQRLNVFRMELLGAKVVSVTSGTKTLKDATNEALRYWVANVEDTFYIIGSAVGPHPYPTIVRDFQRVIGDESRKQILEQTNQLPQCVIACVGGGSNAIGIFTAFLDDPEVELIGVEAAGEGIETDRHAATMTKGTVGILHGMKTYLLQDAYGQISPVHSISAGLDYPGVGPQHAFLRDSGRVTYQAITDSEAMEALILLSKTEGIIPALESAHAVAYALKIAPTMNCDQSLIVCLSGRGDKDIGTIFNYIGGGVDE